MPVPESVDGKVTKADFLAHAAEINDKLNTADATATFATKAELSSVEGYTGPAATGTQNPDGSFTITFPDGVETGQVVPLLVTVPADSGEEPAPDTTAPSVPTSLVATPGDGQVSLVWVASTDAVGVTGYRVYRDGTLIASPTGPSYVDTGRTNGVAYSYTVAAADAAGNMSAQTASVSATPTASPTAPGQVTNLVATPSAGQAVLTWTAPSNGGSAITDYVVEFRTGAAAFAVFADGTSGATGATVTGLADGTAYDFRVSAVNAVGTGTPSATASATTPAAATVPGAPTIGTATGGDGQATVTFTPPASDGGSTITGYTVTSSPGALTATGASSPLTVTGLTNGTAYTFTVTATNGVGTSAPSAASNSVTPAAASALPILATFTRADGVGLPNTETGNKPWALTSVGGTGTATYGVRSNAAAIWGTAATAAVSATVESGAADCTVRVKIGALPASGGPAVVFRMQDQDNYWQVSFTATAISLAKRIAGAYTLVTNVTSTANPAATFAAADVVEVVLSGTSIIARKQGGADLISSTQAQLATATRHGFNLPNADTTARLDDFEVTA